MISNATSGPLARAFTVTHNGDPSSHGVAPSSEHALRPSRDVVSAPGVAPHSFWTRAMRQHGWELPSQRRTLLFFAGAFGTHPVRRALERAVPALNATAVRARLTVHISSHIGSATYWSALSSSLFCVCPRGFGIFSPRIVDAIVHGCVSVLLADTYWLPLSCLLDWRAFSLFLPEGRPQDQKNKHTQGHMK